MGQKALFLDASRCTGCKTCVYACKDAYDLRVGLTYRRVYECTGGETVKDEMGIVHSTCLTYYLSVSCCHCSQPVCTEVCPTRAMAKDTVTGLVSVDAMRCIGCGYCHLACPYGAPTVDKEKGHSVKCDGCKARVDHGEAPVCVLACPARALKFGDLETIATLGDRADVFPLPPAETTYPNFFVKKNHDMETAADKVVVIANEAEVR